MDARAKDYLEQYLKLLSPEQRAAVPSVSADYYCADEYNANVCADLFELDRKPPLAVWSFGIESMAKACHKWAIYKSSRIGTVTPFV